MDLRQLRTFVVVAEAGGFAAAQQQLRLSQPAASRQIQHSRQNSEFRYSIASARHQTDIEGEDLLLQRGRRLLQDADCSASAPRARTKAGALRVGCSTQHMRLRARRFPCRPFGAGTLSADIELVEDWRRPRRLALPRG
jgi:DNA-binding transcriptional LysR family regulator